MARPNHNSRGISGEHVGEGDMSFDERESPDYDSDEDKDTERAESDQYDDIIVVDGESFRKCQ